jgi:hypothetical protein
MSYRYTLNLNTSFTGKDRLYTRLRAGNMANVWTQTDSYLADAKKGDNTLKIDKLWYTFPIGSEFTATIGALVENYYMIETPTRYKPDPQSIQAWWIRFCLRCKYWPRLRSSVASRR